MLKKNPVLSLIALLTLGLGIGANTAIFSIVNSVLIRPLPYRNTNRLFAVHEFANDQNDESRWVARERYSVWQKESQSFEQIAALKPGGVNVRIGSGTHRVQGARITANFFSMLGAVPLHGQLFGSNHPGSAGDIAVLDYYFWQNNFGSDPNVIGKKIIIDGRVHTVTGILPDRFDYLYHQDVWIPLQFTKDELEARGDRSLHILALRKADATLQQAQAELQTISKHLQQLETVGADTKMPRLLPLQELVVRDIRRSLIVFQAAVGFILLIVCVNMTNLILAQSSIRQTEISIRLALGAGRKRVVRQLFLESLFLAFLGGILGIAFAVWTHKILVSAATLYLPFTASAAMDWRVFAFTGMVTLATGILVGLLPALRLSSTDLTEGLSAGARGSASRTTTRWRTALVIGEVALSVILLIGSGLMMKSFWRLQEVHPGFDPNNTLKLRIALPEISYPDPNRRLSYYRESIERLRRLPGVESVAMINWLPFSQISNRVTLNFPDRNSAGQTQEAELHVITTEYLRAMKIPLKQGRAFLEEDDANSRGVIVATETFVRRYFPERNPIGQIVHMDHNGMAFSGEIVGVAADVRNEALDIPPQPAVYVLHLQAPWQTIALREFVVRTHGDAASLAESARAAVSSIDEDVPVYQVQPMTSVVHRSLGARRFNRDLIVIMGFVALTLVIIGVYGLMSFSVAQRTREIGVRMALGAQQSAITALILKQGFTIAVAGIAAGLTGALAITNVMEKLLFGVSPMDPASFAVIGILIAVIILAASYLPARRAANVNPLTALRHE